MKQQEILSSLEEIFIDVLDEEINFNINLTPNDIEDWDSFAQINIISQVESKFNIKFDLSEVLTLNDVHSIVDSIQKKI